MIVVLKHNHNQEQLEGLVSWLQEKGIAIHTSIGEANTILGLVGDTSWPASFRTLMVTE